MPGSGAFEASTPLEAQMKPWCVSVMRSEPRARRTRFASPQDHLDPARVAVTRELARPRRRLDVVELHDPTLELGDRLLCDDEDVPVLELHALGDQAREVVSFAQLRKVRNGEDREAGHRPSIRTPAWPR